MSTEVRTTPVSARGSAGLGFAFTWTKGRLVLAGITVLGVVLAVIRYALTLAPTTNLTDAWPWGVWIGMGVLSGVAVSGGAFSLAAVVYIFNVKRYQHLTRTAVLAGFLGYITVILTLLVELGRPWVVWHPWIYWQDRSVMFEVAWCVTLYSAVLALEFAPVFFERMGWQKWEHLIHKAIIPIVIAGIVLSTLHQSSLGTMFLIMPDKISPLWYTKWLPVFFFVTAIGGGLSMVSLIYSAASRSFGRQSDNAVLASLSKAVPITFLPYLAVRLYDLTARGAWQDAAGASFVSIYFWVELVLGMIVPAVVLLFSSVRNNRKLRNTALALAVVGTVMNRMGVSLIGMFGNISSHYTPHPIEVLIVIGIWTAAALVFLFFAENCRVLPEDLQGR